MNLSNWNEMQPVLKKLHNEETKHLAKMGMLQLIGGAILIPICFFLLWLVSWIIILKFGGGDDTYKFSLQIAIGLFIFFAVGSFFVDFDKLRNFELKDSNSISNAITGSAERDNIVNFAKFFLYAAPRLVYTGLKDLKKSKTNPPIQLWQHLVFHLYSSHNAIEVNKLAGTLQSSENALFELFNKRNEDVILVGMKSVPRVKLATIYREKLEKSAGIERDEEMVTF